MNNDKFRVERDDYVAFIGQLNKAMMDVENYSYQNCTIIKILSKKTGTHLCTRIIDHDREQEEYYVFNYPDDDERVAPKPVMKITLENKEEVQNFFNALSKISKEAHDGRTV